MGWRMTEEILKFPCDKEIHPTYLKYILRSKPWNEVETSEPFEVSVTLLVKWCKECNTI